jgi:hypothetical protein
MKCQDKLKMWNTESGGWMSTQKVMKHHDTEKAIKRVKEKIKSANICIQYKKKCYYLKTF